MDSRWAYVAVLGFVLVGCLWLEVALRTRVLARPRRLLLTIAPVVVVFFVWDVYAVSQGHWWFDTDRILGSTHRARCRWTRSCSSSRSRWRPC